MMTTTTTMVKRIHLPCPFLVAAASSVDDVWLDGETLTSLPAITSPSATAADAAVSVAAADTGIRRRRSSRRCQRFGRCARRIKLMSPGGRRAHQRGSSNDGSGDGVNQHGRLGNADTDSQINKRLLELRACGNDSQPNSFQSNYISNYKITK